MGAANPRGGESGKKYTSETHFPAGLERSKVRAELGVCQHDSTTVAPVWSEATADSTAAITEVTESGALPLRQRDRDAHMHARTSGSGTETHSCAWCAS